MSAGDESRSYTFQITLLAVTPPVWRLFAVPGRLTLAQLHEVIQVVMGWTRAHDYRFDIAGKNYEVAPEAIQPGSLSLDQLDLAQGSSLTYIYDFKDDWVHHLTVQGVAPSMPGWSRPVLLGGAGSCPPEASGGPGGYAEAQKRVGSDPTLWQAGPAAQQLASLGGADRSQSGEGRSRKHRRGRR